MIDWKHKFEMLPADAAQRNVALLQFAMEALYSTMLTNDEAAAERGHAIQAIDRLHVHLTGERLVPLFERHSDEAAKDVS